MYDLAYNPNTLSLAHINNLLKMYEGYADLNEATLQDALNQRKELEEQRSIVLTTLTAAEHCFDDIDSSGAGRTHDSLGKESGIRLLPFRLRIR